MELEVYNIEGKKTSKKVSLSSDVFEIEPNDHAIYLDVKQHLANRRQGTHKAKERSELSGSTRKLHKQKGTGGSRKGSIKNALFKGGPRVFGPRPRDYSFKLNKKLKQLARKSALSYKLKDSSITVLENFTFDTPKTKKIIEILKNLKISDTKTLWVVNNENSNIYLASRNLIKSRVIAVSELNTYEILNNKKLLFDESSLKEIENILS